MTEDRSHGMRSLIGSGMGGLACAAALAKTGHKALVLEQHYVAGELTRRFTAAAFAGTWECTTWAKWDPRARPAASWIGLRAGR